MKKVLLYIIITSLLVACNNQKIPTVVAQDATVVSLPTDTSNINVFKLDSTASTLLWEGYEGLALGKAQHTGSLNITNGTINVQNNLPIAGKFIMPIISLKVTDIPSDKPGNAKLVAHLCDADFFDAPNFATAKFEITNTVPKGMDSVNITGNLTLKGISKSITIPAAININDNILTATTPKFYINRKDWGMHYHSENSLGDEMIRNEMGITLNITAKK